MNSSCNCVANKCLLHNHSLFLPHGSLIPILPHGGLISTFPHRCLIPVTSLCSYSLSYQTQDKVEIIYYLSSKSPIPTHNPTLKHLSSHFQYPQSSTMHPDIQFSIPNQQVKVNLKPMNSDIPLDIAGIHSSSIIYPPNLHTNLIYPSNLPTKFTIILLSSTPYHLPLRSTFTFINFIFINHITLSL